MDASVLARLDEIQRICRRWRVQRLALFGSAASGGFVPGESDLDFIVEFEPLAPAERADAFFGLEADLQALFGIAIDLLEDEALRNPYLRRSIERSKVNLYEAA